MIANNDEGAEISIRKVKRQCGFGGPAVWYSRILAFFATTKVCSSSSSINADDLLRFSGVMLVKSRSRILSALVGRGNQRGLMSTSSRSESL